MSEPSPHRGDGNGAAGGGPGASRGNLPIRGAPPLGRAVRRQVGLVEGRKFLSGAGEILLGASVACQFARVVLRRSPSFTQRQS
jgi:hypothetical protein